MIEIYLEHVDYHPSKRPEHPKRPKFRNVLQMADGRYAVIKYRFLSNETIGFTEQSGDEVRSATWSDSWQEVDFDE